MGNHDELRRKREAAEDGHPEPDDLDAGVSQLDAIGDLADDVADDFEDFEEAIMDERSASAKIMEVALANLGPALDALVGKIETRRASTMVRDEKGQLQSRLTGRIGYYDRRGVLVVNKFAVFHDVPDVEGSYGGTGLYALEGGRWAMVGRSGVWVKREGEASVIELSVIEMDAVEVLKHFRVEAVLEGLVEVLKKQEGLETQTQKVRRRISVLKDGLSALLQGLKS